MSDLHALVYVSTATHLFTDAELEALLLSAVAQNSRDNISGVLLYNDGNFMQCIEGPEPALRATFRRISNSKRHNGIICLYDRKIEKRNFSEWHMGYAKASKSELLSLSSANWKQSAENAQDDDYGGLILLKDFWNRR